MRPNDFILNSDYLTLANIENKTFAVAVPGGVIPSDGIYTATFDMSWQNISGTLVRIYIHHSKWAEPNLWGIGAYGDTTYTDNGNYFYERMFVTTPTDKTVRLSVEIQGDVGTTIPSHTVTIKAFRFKVPNLF